MKQNTTHALSWLGATVLLSGFFAAQVYMTGPSDNDAALAVAAEIVDARTDDRAAEIESQMLQAIEQERLANPAAWTTEDLQRARAAAAIAARATAIEEQQP